MVNSYGATAPRILNSCQENESFRSSLFQKACRAWGSAPQRHSVRSARGEFLNSPVDCLERGEALQERASPMIRPYLFCRVPFWNAVQYEKFIASKMRKLLIKLLRTQARAGEIVGTFQRERPLLQGVPS